MLHAHCAWEYESVVEREMFWTAVTRSKRRQIQKVQDQVLEMLTTFWKPALCEASVAAACSVSTLCAAELSWPDMDSVMAMFPIPKTYCKRKKKLQLTKKGMNICFSYRMLVLTKQHCWNKVIWKKGLCPDLENNGKMLLEYFDNNESLSEAFPDDVMA